jgi:asparagine N-glycosylation enzyme membrane subunit Stt3
MLWTIAVLLLILWLLGMVSSYTLGGFIHILLVLAIIAVLIRAIQGRSRWLDDAAQSGLTTLNRRKSWTRIVWKAS